MPQAQRLNSKIGNSQGRLQVAVPNDRPRIHITRRCLTDEMAPLVSIGNAKYIDGLQGTLDVEVQLRLWQTLDERALLW